MQIKSIYCHYKQSHGYVKNVIYRIISDTERKDTEYEKKMVAKQCGISNLPTQFYGQ